MSWCDAIVVGGGPSGAAAAIALARGGASVALVEASPEADFRPGEALPPPGVALVSALGAAEALAGHADAPGVCSAWGSDAPGHHDFLTSVWGRGLHLDRPRFDAALRGLAEAAGARLTVGRVSRVSREGDGWQLVINDRVQNARWIVDATGRASAVARRLGARRVHLDGLVAVGGVGPGPGDDGLTVVAAVADGWWYRAALGDGRAVRLCMMDRDGAGAMRDPGAWERALARAPLVGAAPAPVPLRALSASTGLLDPMVGPGWLAVGDAACTVDPLSSAGITKALASGQGAAAAILAGDPARHAAAERARFEQLVAGAREIYARERRFDAPFWTRRRGSVWLDPEAPVGPVRAPVPGLTRPEQAALRRAAPSARPASEVVGALCAATALPAWRALSALQSGRERGAL